MFFLSLLNAAQTVDNNPDVGPSPESLIASYAAELETLAQVVGTQFNSESMLASLEIAINAIKDQTNLQPSPQTGELQQQIDTLRQEVQTLPRPSLGTMAALQQANVPWLTFDTAPEFTPPDVGTMAWDGGTTMGLQATASVLIRIGESEFVYVKASSAITKGQLCYHSGVVGSSGVITAAPSPINLADPNQIVGVAAEDIALNGFGLIQISGVLRGFNTTGSSVGETWADGDPLYYNPAYVGSFTKTKPSAPSQKTFMGEVINAGSGGSGSMSIRIVPGSILGGTDSNVQFTSLANNDLIQYDSTLQYWKNVPASTLPVGTATNIAGGAAGSVPYQSAPSTTTFLPIGSALQVLKVNAGATALQWVSGAALTKTDDTNVTLTLGGTPATSLLAATSLTLGWTGQLGLTRGGTGVSTTPTNGQLLIGNGTGYTVANLTAGSGVSISNSAGGISISATGTGGTVTSVSVVSANGFAGTVATATTTPAITISTSITGLLYGNGTAIAAATVSAPLTYSAGTLAITQATTSTNGYLSSTDWNTFNNKQPAGTYVTSVTGTSPVVSSGGTTPAISLASGYGDTQNPYASKTANYFLAAPNGSAGVPTFRAIVAADIPSLPYNPTAAPATYTANFSVATTDVWIINNKSGSSCTATLPTASSYSGRVLYFQNYQAQTLVSASSNVVPIGGGAAGTSILLASAGDQCALVSNGTNWIMMQYIPNNILLLE